MINVIQKYTVWIPLVIGAILRTVHIGGRSLWVDEGLTAILVSVPLNETIAGCAVNSNPPLFYICLWPWVRILGLNEFSLGLFAAILGILTIVFVYKLALLIAGRRIAFIAALMTAIAPFMVYASNDSRPYAFLGLMTLIAAYCFFRAINENTWKMWILTGLFTAACIYTHLIGFSVVLMEILYVLLSKEHRHWKFIRNLGLTLAVVAVIYLPQLFTTIFQIKLMRVDDFSPLGAAGRGEGVKLIYIAVKQFLGGFYRILSDYYFMDIGGQGLSQIAGAEKFFFALTLFFSFGLPLLILASFIKYKPEWGLFLMLMYLTPFVQVFWEGVDPRRFTPPASALYIMTAMAFFRWKKSLKIVAVLIFLCISGLSLGKAYSMTSSIFKQEDYRKVSNIIRAQRSPADAVIFHGGGCGSLTWQFYDPGGTIYGEPEYYPNNFSFFGMTPPEKVFSEEIFPASVDSLFDKDYQNVWMIISNRYPPEIMPLVENWYDRYPIEVLHTDQYLTLLKIGPAFVTAPDSMKIE